MADRRTCDTCGAPGARRIESAVAIYDLIPGSPATGHAEGADACDAHREATARALLDFSLSAIIEDAPAIATSLAHAAERDAATAELDAMRATLASYARAEKDAPKDVRAHYDELVARQTAAESARIAALAEQTERTATRAAKLARALKKTK